MPCSVLISCKGWLTWSITSLVYFKLSFKTARFKVSPSKNNHRFQQKISKFTFSTHRSFHQTLLHKLLKRRQVRLRASGHRASEARGPRRKLPSYQVSLGQKYIKHEMGVSYNGGIPKSSILKGFSIINHPFWGIPIFGNTQIKHPF